MSLQIITNSISEEILTGPFRRKEADQLHVLSGYASSSTATRHLNSLNCISNDFSVNLTIGMTKNGAVTQNSHLAFKRLTNYFFKERFFCNYMPLNNSVHSKIYVWTREQIPIQAWSCSANYTQTALYQLKQQEVASRCNPEEAFEIIKKTSESSLNCLDESADECVIENPWLKPEYEAQKNATSSRSVFWSLLSERTVDGLRYGINWGHRGSRNRNEAYIPIPSEIYNTTFFPGRPTNFTVQTDDGYIFTCVREQDNGKAMTTPLNNSDIGLWLRKRIGLKSGMLITKNHLQEANATTVVFTKINEDEYLLKMNGE